jgi:eukaryotic-like serine/threonine-protein kinase
MSVVWLAERAYPNFVRQVAIKRLPAFLKGADHERRLMREASILERLNHPNIAQFFDAGISEDGDPYIAIELIDGEPITDYCDRMRLDVKSRVALMVVVCDAVAFLHRHSVIHRDIKPSNVFVDKSGQVKLLDFGIAKLIDEAKPVGEAAHSTHNAFTPEYAAPEQVSSKPITTATDVYSLGVLLYRMLTGSRPYGRTSPPLMFASAIVNTMPSRPSTLFGRTASIPAGELKLITEARQSSVKQMHANLRNDLDSILLKTLEKDVSRRYATVDKLGEDLRAYLASRPIHAQPPSTFYILRKFAARHRGSVAASALVGLALVSTLAFGAWQARQTHLEAERTKRVLTFLQNLIIEASPNNTGVQTITVLELLRQAPTVAQKQFPNEPELQFEVLKPVEKILRDLEAAEALEPVESAMLKMLPSLPALPLEESTELRREYARTLLFLGKRDDAEAMMRDALDRLVLAGKLESAAHAETTLAYAKLLSLRRAYDQAVPLATESFSRLTKYLSQDDPRLTRAAFNAIELLLNTGRFTEAEGIGEKYFALRHIAAVPTAKERQQFRVMYASLQWYLGNPKAAALEYDKLLEETKKFFGGGDVVYPQLLVLAGRVAIDTAQYEKATRLLNEALSIEAKAASPNRRTQINTLSFIVIANLNQGALKAADEAFLQANMISQQSPVITAPMFWQAKFQKDLVANNLDQAKLALDQQATLLGARETANPISVGAIEIDYANIARLAGNAADSLERCKAGVETLRKRLPAQHYRLARAELRLAQLLALNGTTEQAQRLVEGAAQRIESATGTDHPLALQARFLQGQVEQLRANPVGATRVDQTARAYETLLNRPIDPKLALLH